MIPIKKLISKKTEKAYQDKKGWYIHKEYFIAE